MHTNDTGSNWEARCCRITDSWSETRDPKIGIRVDKVALVLEEKIFGLFQVEEIKEEFVRIRERKWTS